MLILLVVVIVIGVILIVRSGSSAMQDAATSQVWEVSSNAGRGLAPGAWGLVGGIVAALGVAMVGQATFGWVRAFDPPEWLRIMTFWMFPLGVAASAIFGALSLKQNSGRRLGIMGFLLTVLSAIAFFAMVASVG